MLANIPKPSKKDIGRFWAKVEVGPISQCWPWRASCNKGGRGQLGIKLQDGRYSPSFKAHRLAYLLHYGRLPAHLHVCHRCDNPKCCNPAHLFLGTHLDNMGDAEKKGRMPHGEKNGQAKLTKGQVAEIRQRLRVGEVQTAIANDFGVHQVTISNIHTGQTWAKDKD